MASSNQDNELERGLREAERARGDSYDKRTEHLNPDGTGRFINRLILEDSPYLLQHAHNPVNWYPWGAEAFATAQVENKPVFLSIGYSTCHWCHVMEVESFDNVEIAKVLNQHFISIKMDREQFPDIDEIYMTGVQIMSGQGGWPMSNFLLPDGRPFFGATYFPPPTFLKLLQQIASAWQQKYEELAHSAASIDAAIKRVLEEQQAAASLDTGVSEQCVTAILKRADQRLGGLSGAPKFPQEPLLLFMLEQAWREGKPEALKFVDTALEKMGQGGIYDQVGGGFHRYSVDEHWLVPHFEKMLYNQSQLGMVYLQAWRLTGKAAYRRILTQTLDYVLRDMQAPEGGFYSATDADSEGAEGTFFLWTPEQLRQVLEADEAALIGQLYNVSDSGNFEGGNILNLDDSLEALAESRGDPELIEKVQQALEKLYQAREQRVHPLRDNKLIVAWNGAMITTLTWAAYYLERDDWLEAARRAAQTLWQSNFPGDGELRRIRLGDTVSIAGQLEDFAHLAEAFINLFDVTGDDACLHKAAQLMQACETRFREEGQGRLFLSPAQSQGPQLARSTNAADSATLSPVATALFCWQRLRERAALLRDGDALHLQHLVDQSFARLYGAINDQPLSHTSLLRLQAQRLWGPLDAIHYGSEGRAKLILQARQAGNGALDLGVTVQLAPGWHILAPGDGSQYQALTLDFTAPETAARQGWQIAEFDSPEPGGEVALSDGETIPAYTDKLHLRATLRHESSEPASPAPGISLSLQLCDHSRCLLPERVSLLLPSV